jgi:L-rhamnose mutarotase
MKRRRFASVAGLREEKAEKYIQLHAETWPGVLRAIETACIENYSIYVKRLPDGKQYLFSYFEYVGEDFEGDMAEMAAQPIIQKWWDECVPCLEPLPEQPEGAWWASMEEVFHNN